jgi:molybdopterin synthase sulfur carrier subunit
VARVLLFGRFADAAGWREREVAAERLSDLTRVLVASDAVLGEALARPGLQVAVNQAVVRGDPGLAATDEVAYLPPMSGG